MLSVGVFWLSANLAKGDVVAPGAFIASPLLYLYLSLTYFVWATYPASLLTHYLLRRFAIPPNA
jgi:hypothetical protein